jgi:hypothetical protein
MRNAAIKFDDYGWEYIDLTRYYPMTGEPLSIPF